MRPKFDSIGYWVGRCTAWLYFCILYVGLKFCLWPQSESWENKEASWAKLMLCWASLLQLSYHLIFNLIFYWDQLQVLLIKTLCSHSDWQSEYKIFTCYRCHQSFRSLAKGFLGWRGNVVTYMKSVWMLLKFMKIRIKLASITEKISAHADGGPCSQVCAR